MFHAYLRAFGRRTHKIFFHAATYNTPALTFYSSPQAAEPLRAAAQTVLNVNATGIVALFYGGKEVAHLSSCPGVSELRRRRGVCV